MIDKNKLSKQVSLLYHHRFKIFHINEVDGTINPNKLFISLGLTTELVDLNSIKDQLNGNSDYSAKLVEISSKKIDESTFVNNVTSKVPQQYRVDDKVEDGDIIALTAEEANNDLVNLNHKLSTLPSDSDEHKSLEKKVKRLSNFIKRLDTDGSWDNYKILKMKDSSGYRLYHHFVNYEKKDEVEYRIGILIDNEKDDNISNNI